MAKILRKTYKCTYCEKNDGCFVLGNSRYLCVVCGKKFSAAASKRSFIPSFLFSWSGFMILSQWLCLITVEAKYRFGISSHPSDSAQWYEVFFQWNLFAIPLVLLIVILLAVVLHKRKNKDNAWFPFIGAGILIALKKIIPIRLPDTKYVKALRIMIGAGLLFCSLPFLIYFKFLVQQLNAFNGLLLWTLSLLTIGLLASFFE